MITGGMLTPVDAAKYGYLSLPDSGRWGLLLPGSSALAGKAVITKADIFDIPLILHQHIGLQQALARWAQTETEQLHIAAAHNVVNGDPAVFAQSGRGIC